MPSKIVFPLSGSASLYSSCANLEMVLRSEASKGERHHDEKSGERTFAFFKTLKTSR